MAMLRPHCSFPFDRRAPALGVLAALATLGLAACSVVPNDGPSGGAVARGAAGRHYALVDVNYGVIQAIADHPDHPLASIAEVTSAAPNDLIGEGDALTIGIYQAGPGPMMLGGSSSEETRIYPSDTQTVDTQVLPRIVVGRDGMVMVPFAGEVKVIGLTPSQAAAAIQSALKGRAINPQVVVSVLFSNANSVIVIGEVKNTGRYPLSASNDRLLDAIAEAGGVSANPADLVVSVTRGDHTATIPMIQLVDDASQNVRLAPGDQVRVISKIRKIEAFGSLGHVSEVPMTDNEVTLAGALARSSGLNPFTANATSVLLFRFERPEVAKALGVQLVGWKADAKVPIVYRLDLRDPQGYFLATKFQMQPDDLIDVPEAGLAQIQKFFTLVSSASSAFYYYTIIGVEAPRI